MVLIKDSLNGSYCYYVNDNLMNFFHIFFVCECALLSLLRAEGLLL